MTKKILFIAENSGISENVSGIEAVVAALLNYQKNGGLLWNYGLRPNFVQTYSVQHPDQIRFFSSYGLGQYKFSPSLYRELVWKNSARPDLLHHHGFWGMSLHSSLQWHEKYGRPLLLSPHGAFSTWTLQKNSLKKTLAGKILFRRRLGEIDVIHALNRQEVVYAREYGYRKPIAEIPNGIDKDWLNSSGNAKGFHDRFDIPKDRRILLFCGRLNRGKGFDLLLPAWKRVVKKFPQWLCVIAGPRHTPYEKEIQAMIHSLHIDQTVKMIGSVVLQGKRDAMAAADAFVLPSHTEGFPVTVLEALGCGCPCIATTTSNVPFVEEGGCGWCPEPTVDSLEFALESAMSRDKETLHKMGQAGKELVASRFTWNHIIEMYSELYDWMLGEGEKPKFIYENDTAVM